MKTTLTIQLVFESDKYSDPIYTGEEESLPELTLVKMRDIINSQKIDIEMILDLYGKEQRNILVIKQKDE